MTATNDRMRAALRDIEGRAAAALHNQPENSDECGRHLNKALAGIAFRAHVARLNQTAADFPPLEYAGRGQIVNTATHRLVSPRLVAEMYNRLVAERKRESPAGGVETQVPRNGEAEAEPEPLGRESVAQEGTRSNTGQ